MTDVGAQGHDGAVTDEQWSDLDQSQFNFEALDDEHPSRVVTTFNDLHHLDVLPLAALEQLVTPEARRDWGDFSAGRRFFLDQALAVSTRALRPSDAHDVAYVKLVHDSGAYVSEVPREPLAYVTLVWRPDLGGWRIHRIGAPAASSALPRTDWGRTAPRYDTDVEVAPVPVDQSG